MFALIKELECFDMVNATMSKHVYNRSKRMEIIKNLIHQEDGKICKIWLVDTGHRNGLEVHIIYNNGVCLIYNHETRKLITGLILRINQVKRYNIAPTKCMLKKVKKHIAQGYNYIDF